MMASAIFAVKGGGSVNQRIPSLYTSEIEVFVAVGTLPTVKGARSAGDALVGSTVVDSGDVK